MVLPHQAMAWVQYWFRVLGLKFCGKSKKNCGDISPQSPAFFMYDGISKWCVTSLWGMSFSLRFGISTHSGLVLKMSAPWSLVNTNIVTQETGFSPVPIQTPKVIHYSVMVKPKTIFLITLKSVRYVCNRIYQPIFLDVSRFPRKMKTYVLQI